MKKHILLLSAALLVSCGANNPSPASSETSSGVSSADSSVEPVSSESVESPSKNVTWITPTGTPTLAFYDQGDNANWFSTAQPANFIPAAFSAGSYDAIVFDATSGLNLLNKQLTAGKEPAYKLARFISGGTFYVVSTLHASGDAFPENATIDAFVQTGNASKAFLNLASNRWNWGNVTEKTTFEDGVAAVQTKLLSNPSSYDYYVVAEPVLTAVTGKLKAQGITLNVIYNIQTEWAAQYDGATIPAAGLFVSASTYASHENWITSFLKETSDRIDVAVDNPSVAVEALNAYGEGKEENAVQARFGYASALAGNLQSDGKNRFGLLKSSSASDPKALVNSFQTSLGAAEFPSSLFLG